MGIEINEKQRAMVEGGVRVLGDLSEVPNTHIARLLGVMAEGSTCQEAVHILREARRRIVIWTDPRVHIEPSVMTLVELRGVYLQGCLDVCDGNRADAAKMAGIGERTMYRHMHEYQLVAKRNKWKVGD